MDGGLSVPSGSAGRVLDERLHFEDLLFELSARLVHLPGPEMDAEIERGLGLMGRHFEVERALLWELTPAGLRVTHAWSSGRGARLDEVKVRGHRFDWALQRLQQGEVLAFSGVEELPAEATEEQGYWRDEKIQSSLAIPVLWNGGVEGVLTLAALRSRHSWPAELVRRLRLVGEMFVSALARKRAEESWRAGEELKQAVLSSLPSEIAVLDSAGTLVAVNESWNRVRRQAGLTAGDHADLGRSYLDVFASASAQEARDDTRISEGIGAVLQGESPSFEHEYACHLPAAGVRWFALTVRPFGGGQRGAVVVRTDITHRQQVEELLRQQTAELAHAARVTTLGELSAALAHELNQPLTAIAANAQAALRMLDAPAPDLREASEALQDVIRDTQRAGETIRRMRSLLWKGDLEKHPVDVNEAVRSIEVFAKADGLQSGISLRLDLAPELSRVLGDRIQLQQVLLNLIHNGLEAMRALAGPRELVVQTSQSDAADEVRVSVRDAGPPLAASVLQRMFEPFYTTKPGGLGMGLSISRSILEAHGGRLWAEPNPDQGITVRFTLPALKENGHASS